MRIEDLHSIILSAVPDSEIFLRDLNGTGDHFEAFVVSASFEGKRSLERQRTVMDSLKDLLKGPLHALVLKTYTPTEWEKQS